MYLRLGPSTQGVTGAEGDIIRGIRVLIATKNTIQVSDERIWSC